MNILTAAGLSVPNPRDATSQRCPEVHCAGAVATDTLSILIFGRSRDAQLYEASLSNGYQIGDVVLEFAPAIGAAQRTAYERIVARAVVESGQRWGLHRVRTADSHHSASAKR